MLATVTEDGEAKVGATADGIAATVAAGICNSTNAAAGGSPLMGQAQVDVDRFGRPRVGLASTCFCDTPCGLTLQRALVPFHICAYSFNSFTFNVSTYIALKIQ